MAKWKIFNMPNLSGGGRRRGGGLMAPVVEGEGKSTHPVTAYLPDVTAAPLSLQSEGHRDLGSHFY